MADNQGSSLGRDFAAGAQAVLPLLLSVLPFALITGVVAVQLGFSAVVASAFSLVVFAGASQIVAMQLIHDGAPLAIILLTVAFINLRFTMYSASIAPYFRGASAGWKALAGYLLTDQAYVLGLYGFAERDGIGRRLAFYLGVALPLWFGWQVATVLGATLGARLPAAWGLDFAIPLTFMALVMPALRDAPSWAAAATGGAVAVAAHDLPWNLGLIAGALAGIAAGMAGARIRGEEPEAP
ncbi:AzlC family ABC transporter permease [Salinisphaera orenii]|uniref:Branched-chain amino acid ABC transporter permease n=1 Tax=Salinisphaera orenii YIM 95161 TaxID=1051139 RepID=A0A423PG58_9GAMM|nr:AzlC family ABC transporter permease [Salinisphaera halophila]ROO24611.1 branched-chain amino acid ABC transporter permease [Salinisphaera halophila YIM 95161]